MVNLCSGGERGQGTVKETGAAGWMGPGTAMVVSSEMGPGVQVRPRG